MTQETDTSFVSLSRNAETGEPEEETEVNKSLVLPTIAVQEYVTAEDLIHRWSQLECKVVRMSSTEAEAWKEAYDSVVGDLERKNAEQHDTVALLKGQIGIEAQQAQQNAKEQDDTLQEMARIFRNDLLQANKSYQQTLQDMQTRLDNQAESIIAYRGKVDKAEELVLMNANQFDVITDLLQAQIASCKNLHNNQKQIIGELTNELTKMREDIRLDNMLINDKTAANGELKMKIVDLEKKIAELEDEEDDDEEEEEDDKPHWACPYCLKTGGFPVITNTSRTCCENCAMTSDKPPEPTALLPNWALADLLKVKPTIAADVLDKHWIGILDQKQILSRRQQLRGKPFIPFMKRDEHNWKQHTLMLTFCFFITFLFLVGSVHKHGLTLRTIDGMTRCDMDAVRAWPNSFDTRKACYGKLGIADTLSEMVMRPYAVFDNKGIRDAEIAKTSAWLTGNKTLLTLSTTAMSFLNDKFMQVVSHPETDIEAIKEYLELLHPEVEEWKSYTTFAESAANLHTAIYNAAYKADLDRQLKQEAQIVQDAKQKLAEYRIHYDLFFYLWGKGQTKPNNGYLTDFENLLTVYKNVINDGGDGQLLKHLETLEKQLAAMLRQMQQLPTGSPYVMIDPGYKVTDAFVDAMAEVNVNCYVTNQIPVQVVCP